MIEEFILEMQMIGSGIFQFFLTHDLIAIALVGIGLITYLFRYVDL